MKSFSRLVSIFLVLALIVQMLPTTVLAEGNTLDTAVVAEETTISGAEAEPGRPGTTVVGELTDRRAENEKHFRMDDGSFIAVDYGAVVHYTTDDGETWEDIDNTLMLAEGNRGNASEDAADAEADKESLYLAENGTASRGFAPDLSSGLLFSATNGSFSLRMGLVGGSEGRGDETVGDEKAVAAPGYNTSSVAEISYPDVKARGGEGMSLAEQVIPSKLRADVLYRNVYDGVDLSYELYSYDIKETILINQPRDNYSFSFSLDLEALTPELLEDGSIELRDADGKTIYLIPAPYMIDAAGNCSDAVSYSMEKSDSENWRLTVIGDETWINAEDRVFPVSIDPTVIDKVAWSAQGIGATYVVSGAPSTTHTHYQTMWLGYTPYNNLYEHQIYVGWDTLPTVPSGSEVVNAGLYLGQLDYQAVGPASIIGEIHAVSSSRPNAYSSNYNWICGLSWNTKPTLASTVLDYTTMSSSTTGHYISWDITALVKAWYQEGNTQTRAAGIKLYSIGSYNTSYYATAKFHGYGSGTGPMFAVTYRDMTGIEPYYSYQALGADRAGAAYISDYTGALTTVTPLVSYASTVNPFSLNLVYNSSYFKNEAPDNVTVPLNLGYGMHMGSGMKLDLLQKVEYIDLQYEVGSTATQRYIKYTDGDGTVHYFAPDADKQANEPSGSPTYYYDEDGLGLKISEYATNYFRMEDDKGNKMTFVHGFLTMIDDANGNRLRIWFSDSTGAVSGTGYPIADGYKPDHIKQVNKNQTAITVATFSYDNSDGANTLHSITDAAGNVYTFHYSCHKLLSIQRNGNAYVEYLHPFNTTANRYVNPVVGVKDSISSYSLHFTYTDSKISSYYEKVGSTQGAGANITRIPGEKTTYTDWGNDRTQNTADDLSTTYLFDYAGRTVNAYSTDTNGKIIGASNAVYTGTGDTNKKNNRTLQSSGIGMAGVSMVRNGGFELSGGNLDWTTVIPENSDCFATVKTGELTRTGTKAFKTWVSSSATGPTGAKKLIGILTAGETYTASVFVNTSAATGFGSKGIYLRILDSYGSYKTGEYLNYKTDTLIEGGWVRLSFTFTADRSVNHYVCVYDEGVKGAVYYDDLQVEAGNAYTNVNLLDNGGVTSSSVGWLTESNSTPTVANVPSIQGENALQINGNPKTDKYIHQTVPLNQPGTQTYVLSGWAKANAVPDNVTTASGDTEEEKRAKDTNKQFGLRAVLTYSDNTKEYHYVPFNADVTDWQFASLTIVPKQPTKTVSTVQVICAYEKNANTAYFDNLSLVKEVAQTMKYDEDGNLVSVQASGTKEETSTYNNGNLTQVKTGGSGTFDYTYDSKHNLTEATNGTVKEKYTYDSVSNVLTTALTKAEGNPTTAETIKGGKTYTNGGNLVLTDKGANGCYTTFTYGTDASKMFGAATKVTNPVGTETVTNYLNDGRVSSSWISSYVAVTRTYNSNGYLTKLNRGGYYREGDTPNTPYNQRYNFSYDTFGNTTNITVGNTSTYNLGSYTYAPKDGLLTGMTYGNGATVSYSYDDYGRKTQTTTSSGDSYTYAYAGDGQLYEMKDVSGNLLYRYTYDTLGRLIGSSMKSGSNVTLQTQHQYDDANRLSKQTWALPGKTYQENYVYDEDNGRLTKKKITLPTGETANITLGYDDLSRVSTVTTPAATTTFAYAGALYGGGTTGLVSELTTTSVHTGSSVFAPLQLRYTYDALGNIRTEKKLNPSGSTAETLTYTYDNQSQLTKAVSSVNGTWNYQYDTYGNIRHQDHGSDAINYTYGDSNWLDLLTAVCGTKNGAGFSGSYVYDGAGNPTSFFNVGDLSTWTMTWKNGRELATANNGTHNVSYDYDVNGLRTYKIVDGVRHDYTYASGQLLRETYTQSGSSYTLDFIYDQTGRPYMLYLTTTTASGTTSAPYYYILNLQGDVIHLVNTSGVAVASYTYDPYGAILTSAGSLADVNPLRYRGYYYDNEISFYYLQSRYYNPSLGRFINSDSYASTGTGFLGYNMFAYCLNCPIIYADYLGTRIIIIIYDANEKKRNGDDNSFIGDYAAYESKSYSSEDEVILVPVRSMGEFIEEWNYLDKVYAPGEIDVLEIIVHGNVDLLGINGVQMTEGGTADFSQLKDLKSVKYVNLYSCYGGRKNEKGNSVAQRMANKTGATVWASTGKVYYCSFLGIHFIFIDLLRNDIVFAKPIIMKE